MANKTFLIKTLVEYEPTSDQSLPARGLRLSFGDVVAVIDANDNNWWRACPIDVVIREDDSYEVTMLRGKSGLIPSSRRFKRKLLKKLIRKVKWNEEDLEHKMHFAPFPHEYLSEQEYNERMKQKSKRKKNEIDEDNDNSNLYHTSQKFGSYKNMTAERESRVMSAIAYQDVDKPLLTNIDSTNSNSNQNNNINNGDQIHNARSNTSINTLYSSGLSLGIDPKMLENKRAYEIVEASLTQLSPRPVMILGLLRDKLHSALINHDQDKFAFVVPHTTRAKRDKEINGQDYHFISRSEMQHRIDNKEFIEAGVYRDNLYGTSVQAVRDIANENKFALLDVSGGAINNLISHDIDPIVILIKLQNSQWLLDANPPFAATEQEADLIFTKELQIEEIYREHCTWLITVSNLDSIEDITREVLRVVEKQTPIVWKKSKEPIENL